VQPSDRIDKLECFHQSEAKCKAKHEYAKRSYEGMGEGHAFESELIKGATSRRILAKRSIVGRIEELRWLV